VLRFLRLHTGIIDDLSVLPLHAHRLIDWKLGCELRSYWEQRLVVGYSRVGYLARSCKIYAECFYRSCVQPNQVKPAAPASSGGGLLSFLGLGRTVEDSEEVAQVQ
jgi:hypothetical protein